MRDELIPSSDLQLNHRTQESAYLLDGDLNLTLGLLARRFDQAILASWDFNPVHAHDLT